MLLSTGYIAQGGQGGQGGQQGGHKKGGQNAHRGGHKMNKEQVATELGGSVSFESVNKYAESYGEAINRLNSSSTAEEFKAVMDKGGTLKSALMQLAPKPGKSGESKNNKDSQQNETPGAKLPKGGKRISGGPMRGKMPADNTSEESAE